jgi:hypothetical protein
VIGSRQLHHGNCGKKIKKQSTKETLAQVTEELAKPRVAKSVREHNHTGRNVRLVVEHDIQQRTMKLQLGLAIVNEG